MLEIENEAKGRGTSVPIEIAREVNVSIIKVTGVDVLKWFKEHPITTEVLPIALGGISLSIEDPKFQMALAKGAEVILGALGTALSAAAKFLDPYLAQVVKALNFNTAITAAKDAIMNAGQAIWIHIFNGIRDGFVGQDWGQLFAKFPAAVDEAWKTNAPELQKSIFENWKSSWLAAQLGMSDMKFPVAPEVVKDAPQIIQKSIDQGAPKEKKYTIQAGFDSQKMPRELQIQLNKAIPKNTKIPVGSDLTKASQGVNQFVNKVNNTHATIKLSVAWGPGQTNQVAHQLQNVWGGGKQHGYQSTVHRPTAFIAGEGGRPEDVIVRPRGSVQRGGGGGGGFYGTVNVYVDGVSDRQGTIWVPENKERKIIAYHRPPIPPPSLTRYHNKEHCQQCNALHLQLFY